MRILTINIWIFIFSWIQINAQEIRDSITEHVEKEAMMTSMDLLERDMKEYKMYTKRLKEFEAAWLEDNFTEVRRIKDSLVASMKREIEQGGEKLYRDSLELGRSKSEQMFEEEGGTRDRRNLLHPDNEKEDMRDLQVETRDVKENKQDVRDELVDLRTQEDILQKQKGILSVAASYIFTENKSDDPEAVDVREHIFEFAYTMQRDLELLKAEFMEDKSEYREETEEK